MENNIELIKNEDLVILDKKQSLSVLVKEINESSNNIVNEYLTIGKNLKEIKEKKLYLQLGYKGFYEMSKNEFNFSETMCKNLISVFNKFAKEDSYYIELKEDYEDYNFSQLVELVSVSKDAIKDYDSTMSVKEIRSQKLFESVKEDKDNLISYLKNNLFSYFINEAKEKGVDLVFKEDNTYYDRLSLNIEIDKILYDFCLDINNRNDSLKFELNYSNDSGIGWIDIELKDLRSELSSSFENFFALVKKKLDEYNQIVLDAEYDEVVEEYEEEVILDPDCKLHGDKERKNYLYDNENWEPEETVILSENNGDDSSFIKIDKLIDLPEIKRVLLDDSILYYLIPKDGRFRTTNATYPWEVTEYMKDKKI